MSRGAFLLIILVGRNQLKELAVSSRESIGGHTTGQSDGDRSGAVASGTSSEGQLVAAVAGNSSVADIAAVN